MRSEEFRRQVIRFLPFLAAAFWACVMVAIQPRVSLAQGTSYATLYGTVADTSGAVIPGVKVTATNTGTSLASSGISGPNGGYVIPDLPPGTYQVEATRAGFATFVARGVVLFVAQSTRVNVVMKPGKVTQQVTVTGGTPLIDTQSMGLKGTVERQFMDQLPLINRDAHLLEHIQAGTGSGANGTLTVDGVRGGHNEYELNGLSIDDPAFTQFVVDPAFPTPDAIQEFTMITNGYSAEYGRNEGGQVLVETRSGTNEFHGSAFDYLRNQALNARPFFASGTTPYKRNIFGGTYGGPLRKNKLFFFGSYEGTRTRSTPNAGIQNFVPTQAERTGDFSAVSTPIVDPTTGQPFAGNQIPAARLNPITQNLINALVPLPNGPNGELIFAPDDLANADQGIIKLDAVLSTKDRFSGTYFINRTNSDFNQGLPKVFQTQQEHDQIMSLDEIHTFNPDLFNDVTIGWLKYHYLQGPEIPGNPTLATFGAKYFIPPTQPQQLSVHVDGDLSIETGGPLVWPRQFLQAKDDLHWIKGKHSLAIGAGAQWGRFWNTTNFIAAGRFIFQSTFTGNDFADFMLGTPTTFLQNSGAYMPQVGQDYDLYAQDTWRVKRNLTLNLGLRYAPTFYEKLLSKENSNFIPGEQSSIFPKAPVGLVYQGDAGVNAYYHNPAWGVFEPRVGFAWAPFGSSKWAIRTAFGVFHEPMMIFSADNNLSPPYGLQVVIPGPPSFANPYQGGVDPFPFTPVLPTSPASERASITFDKLFPLTLGDYFSQDFKVPTDLQWNLTIQRQLTTNDGLEVAYAGSRNYREPFIQDANPPTYIPGESTEGNIDSRRPLAPFFSEILLNEPLGFSNYHSLQVTYRHNAGYGLTVLANYTWSKTLNLGQSADQLFGGVFNPFDLRSDYGPASFDIEHRANLSYVWQLPWLSGRQEAWAHLAKGWTFSGIFSAMSGGPITVFSGVDNSRSGYGNDHADQVGDSHLPGGRNRGQQIQEWFNTAAFTTNALGTFGNTGQGILRGPGGWSWDMSLFRNFPLGERFKLQYRLDASNVFNHTVLGGVNATVTSGAFGRVTSTGDPRLLQMALRLIF